MLLMVLFFLSPYSYSSIKQRNSCFFPNHKKFIINKLPYQRRRHVKNENVTTEVLGIDWIQYSCTGCPTRYQTRHFFNNSNINENIATKQTHTTDTFLFISHTTNQLLFKFSCNIFIGVRIIKEMPGSVASGTPCRSSYTSCTFLEGFSSFIASKIKATLLYTVLAFSKK
jgi:hypothetical protein